MAKEIQVPIDSSLIKKVALRFGSENEDIIAGVEAYIFYGIMHHEDVLRFYSPTEEIKRGEIVVWEEWKRKEGEILAKFMSKKK